MDGKESKSEGMATVRGGKKYFVDEGVDMEIVSNGGTGTLST